MKKIIAAVGIVVLMGVVSSGCGSKASPRPSAAALALDPNDPFSAYLADDVLTINSATRELDYRCYAENGYPEFLEVLPAQKANQFRSLATTPDFKTTFTEFSKSPWFSSEEAARATGYGRSIAGLDAQVINVDGSAVEVARDCNDATQKKLSGIDETLIPYVQLGDALAEALATSSGRNEKGLTKRVFECMEKSKYPVDPNGPNKSPIWGVDFGIPLGAAPRLPEAPELTQGYGKKVIPAEPTQRYLPTPQESESAAAMYRCSVETGARDEWVKAVNEVKNAALAKHEATLLELNPKIKELAKSAVLALQAAS